MDDPELIELPAGTRLDLDLDLRLRDVWRQIDHFEQLTLEVVAALLRAAYGQGYVDALRETDEAALLKAHGFRIPTRGESR